jgi:hypothetical protein
MTAPTTPGPAVAQLVIAHATANAYYARAIHTPEWQRAMELRSKAFLLRTQLPPIPPLPMPDSPDDDLAKWLDDVRFLDEAERVHSIEYKALSGLINKCDNTIQGVVHQKDRILTSLAADLAEIMNQVRQAVERLDGARTPAEAIDRGVTDAWRDLQPLRDELETLWTAQDWVMAGDQRVIHSRSQHIDDPLATDLRIANLDEVFSDWKHPAPNQALQRWEDRSRLQPWPADPIEQLPWIATSGAKLWCPTLRQLDELKAQRLAERAHPDGPPQQKSQRVELNQAPRAGYYDRVIPDIQTASGPIELDLIEEGV